MDGHIRTPGSDLTYWLAFDRLVDYDDKAKPQPGLAETWDVAPDYKTVTFHLRKGVTYHSGREFTSDDVKWNFLRVRTRSWRARPWARTACGGRRSKLLTSTRSR